MSFYMRHVERELLSALVDGELPPTERRFVHEHLRSCAECREAAEEFAHIHGLVGELPRLVAPESFVAAALRPRRRILYGRRAWVAVAVAAASIGITVAGPAVPEPASAPPVDVLIEQHAGISAPAGPSVVFAVHGR